MATFGEANAGSEMSARILSRDGDSLLVEFKTQFSMLFGFKKKIRTVEQVTLNEPQSIDFEEAEGPFALRQEHITLSERDGETHIRYEANIGLKSWVLGWLFGILFVRPLLKRIILRHFNEIKEKLDEPTESLIVKQCQK